MSGAGKSTIANLLEKSMRQKGLKVELLDGDVIRQNLSPELGFSRNDRFTNIKRVAFVAKMLSRNDIIVIAALISPYVEFRAHCRNVIGTFIEVYVKCPLDVLIRRDTKGLYKEALSGGINNFTGISDPYEAPLNAELTIETDKETAAESAQKIMTWLEQKGFLATEKILRNDERQKV